MEILFGSLRQLGSVTSEERELLFFPASWYVLSVLPAKAVGIRVIHSADSG